MTDLIKLEEMLRELTLELANLGAPRTLVNRVTNLRAAIPTIEQTREKRTQ